MREPTRGRALRKGIALTAIFAALGMTTVALTSATGAVARDAAVTQGIPAPYVSTTMNGSDPHAHPCVNNSVSGYCLWTSQDLNEGSTPYGNSYPMTQTMGYFSSDGINWAGPGLANGTGKVLLTEQQYQTAGWVPTSQGAVKHLWAPDAAQGTNGNWYLYDPDIRTTMSPSTSSFIGISKSTNGPMGTYALDAQFSLPQAQDVNGNPIAQPNGGYASDPDVFGDTSGNHWIAWANGGDVGGGNDCGGLSITQLDNSTMDRPASGTVATGIDIQGVPTQWGATCTDSFGLHHFYEEGSHIYNTSSWGGGMPGPYLLAVPIKPNNTPNECVTNVQGQPGTANEVVAWATATNPRGPYTYGGLLACGSQKEFTDQGSLLQVSNGNTHGRKALIMIYHDAAPGSGGHHRMLHGECLMYGNSFIGQSIRTGGTTIGQSGAVADCLNNLNTNMMALRSSINGRIVSGNSTGNSALLANRYTLGPYEHFSLTANGSLIDAANFDTSGLYVSSTIKALSNNGAVSGDPNTHLVNNFYTSGDGPNGSQFNVLAGNGFMWMYSVSVGNFAEVRASNSTVYAEVSPPGTGEAFQILHY